MRDTLPDEAFARLRGALHVGPSFKVTRNKLQFFDNLSELLATATPGMRHAEHALLIAVATTLDRHTSPMPELQH